MSRATKTDLLRGIPGIPVHKKVILQNSVLKRCYLQVCVHAGQGRCFAVPFTRYIKRHVEGSLAHEDLRDILATRNTGDNLPKPQTLNPDPFLQLRQGRAHF